MRSLYKVCAVLFIYFIYVPLVAAYPLASDGYLAEYTCRVTQANTCPVVNPIDPKGENVGSKFRIGNNLSMDYFGVNSTIRAGAQFSSESLLPILRAFAATGGSPDLPLSTDPKYTGRTGYIADANIWAVEKFRYTGDRPREILLSAVGETSFRSGNSFYPDVIGHSMMSIAAFTGTDYRFDIDGPCPFGNFYGCSSHTTSLGSVSTYLDPSVHANVLQIFLKVVPGQEFFIGGFLDANVCCNAVVDTSHTMRMTFDDSSDLELLEVPGAPVADVPEPQSAALTLAGLIAFAFSKRCKRFING